jgi:hypothetical protein
LIRRHEWRPLMVVPQNMGHVDTRMVEKLARLDSALSAIPQSASAGMTGLTFSIPRGSRARC